MLEDKEKGVLRVQALVGDRIRTHANTVGQPDREGEIVEVRGSGGGPPYLVRFEDGHTGLVFPGPDTVVVPSQRRAGS